MKIQILIIILLYYVTSNTNTKLKCGTGLHIRKTEPGFVKAIQNINDKRKLDSTSIFEPIRIKVDYTQLKIDTKNYPYIFNILKESLDSASHYFELLLKVKRMNMNYISPSYIKSKCNIDNIDENINDWGDDYDLILLPSFEIKNPMPEVYASATACLLFEQKGRPKVGRIYIENNFNFRKNNIKIFLQTILFHEMTHIFVFDPKLFSYFSATKEFTIHEEKKHYIVSPKALAKARFHFGCDTLEGIPLESQGGDGSANSHWEARYMLGDYMVSINYYENVISDITLALFEDSGWYEVNYYTGGLFRFGKNEGCSFFERQCIENKKAVFPNEFCDKKLEPKCLNSHLGYGICYIGEYDEGEIPSKYQYFNNEKTGGLFNADFCPVSDINTKESLNISYFENNCKYGDSLNIFSHYGEVIGNDSICFESSLVPRYSPQPYKWRSICYPISCDRENKQIIVYINDMSVVCPFEGGTLKKIKGFKGKINCPKYNMICTSDIWCNDMFECIDKKSITDEYSYYEQKVIDL